MIKKILSLFILTALIFSFSACGAEEAQKRPADTTADSAVTTAPADTADTEWDYEPLKLPELDYGGAKVRILTDEENEYIAVDKNGSEYENVYAGELTVEELTNEPVNDAVYNREIFVEDLLGVDIERIQTPDNRKVREYVELMYASGDNPAEIISASCAATMWSSQFGYYRDLYNIETLFLASPWWSQDFNAESSFGGKLYFATGDLSLTLLRTLYVTYFNKDIAKNNGIEGVYDTVFNGEWTVDRLAELSSKIYLDVNGNSEADEYDTYGFLGEPGSTDPLWAAFDIDICSKNDEDYLEYTPNLEKFGIAHEKMLSIFKSKSTYQIGEAGIYQLFTEGRALFAPFTLGKVESDKMRNMQDDYGIIPLPKFDAAQKGYYTSPHDQYTVFAICATMQDAEAEMAGAVMEAMAWYSYRYVKPAYLNIAMKGKYANDQETRRMLDIITGGFRIDAAWIYAAYLAEYPQEWRNLIRDRNESYTSVYASKERNIKICMKGLNDTYRALADE